MRTADSPYLLRSRVDLRYKRRFQRLTGIEVGGQVLLSSVPKADYAARYHIMDDRMHTGALPE